MKKPDESTGVALHALIERMFPICRSITGDGVRETLQIIREMIPLEIHEVPSGTAVFDWVIPHEWNIREAWIKGPNGAKIVDFSEHNLHVVNYSEPVSAKLSLEDLQPHLHTLPEQPSLIPYKTSYYRSTWGFCIPHALFETLDGGTYEVFIDSTLKPGNLSYGELLIPGERDREYLFSAHVCHPSLANDNLSGISVLTFLARILLGKKNRYSYRFLFAPGTIGAITWLARNEARVERIEGGIVASLLGDRGDFSFKRSRRGNTNFDGLVQYALEASGYPHKVIDFSPYGYDERQFCSPGFDLAVGNLSRSVFGTFPEYHTSADDLEFVTAAALAQSLDLFASLVEVIEDAEYLLSNCTRCEPQLGKYGLYDSVGGNRTDSKAVLAMLWAMNGSGGSLSLQAISQVSGIPVAELREAANRLVAAGLLA
jgi:aminopeptidase-like protein